MSSDKLSRTALAAGFAMACEDLAAPAPERQARAEAQVASPSRVAEPAKGLMAQISSRFNLGLGLTGWSFWKTA